MAIDKRKQVNASVVLDRTCYERLKRLAAREKRSISKQIAYWIEEHLKAEDDNH